LAAAEPEQGLALSGGDPEQERIWGGPGETSSATPGADHPTVGDDAAEPFVPPAGPGPFGARTPPEVFTPYGAQALSDDGRVPLRDERPAPSGGIGIYAPGGEGAPPALSPRQSLVTADAGGAGGGAARTRENASAATVTVTKETRQSPAVAPGQGDTLLQLVNAVRASGYTCGGKLLPPAPPLRENELLAGAAQTHARAMADRGYLSSAAPDGRTLGRRVSDSGYIWGFVAENIAAKSNSAEQTLQGWLANESQCANLLGREYTEAGAGYDSRGRFWVFTLATPMEQGALRLP
jgi:uncharacterized protein YkwD